MSKEQPEDLQLPTLPFAVFDEFGQPCEDRVRDHFAAAFEELLAQSNDNWQQYATEREATAQAVIERHRREIKSLLNLLSKDRGELQALRAQIGQGVLDGWQLVPKEPTDEMVRAALHLDLSYMPGHDGPDRAAVYKAMLASAPPAPQQQPIGWLYDWTHSSALGKPDEHFTSFTTDEEQARKHSNARPVFDAAHNIGEKK